MITVDKETRKFEFYKKHEGDKIWWVEFEDEFGSEAVSFDKKKSCLFSGTILRILQRKRRICSIRRILTGRS